jgi:peptidoglycan/xylan/chitin deacetylase (PgdA/CDA1 family)
MRRRLPWPEGVSSALLIGFDVDAETMWTSKDPRSVNRPSVLSHGQYEIEVGLPLILDMLDRKELKSTFFVPGWVADTHPAAIEQLHARGHEIAHHGYLHDSMDGFSRERELEVIQQASASIERITGKRPVGYRAPLYDVNPHTWDLLRDEGFLYSSNMMDTAWPYLHDGEGSDLVELPVQWMLDDGPYYLVAYHPLNYRQVYAPETVISIWRQEFEGIHGLGGAMTLTLHPQLTGRPSRLAALERLIDEVREFPGVWMPTHAELASGCLAAAAAA